MCWTPTEREAAAIGSLKSPQGYSAPQKQRHKMAASHGMADLKMSFTATFHEIEPPPEQDLLRSASLVPPGSAVSAALSLCKASLLVIGKKCGVQGTACRKTTTPGLGVWLLWSSEVSIYVGLVSQNNYTAWFRVRPLRSSFQIKCSLCSSEHTQYRV